MALDSVEDVFDQDTCLFVEDTLRQDDVEEGEVGVLSDDLLLTNDIPPHSEIATVEAAVAASHLHPPLWL